MKKEVRLEKGNLRNWAWIAAILLGSVMVARGEIGQLIIKFGHNILRT